MQFLKGRAMCGLLLAAFTATVLLHSSSQRTSLSKQPQTASLPSLTASGVTNASEMVRRRRREAIAAFGVALTGSERRLLIDLTEKVAAVCEKLKIVCMMYGGTLLGSYRHHDLIPWDDDVDMFINHRYRDLVKWELKMISDDYKVEYAGPRMKFFSRIGQQYSKFPWKWPYIDISFYSQNATHIADAAKDMQRFVYPRHVMFPVHKRPLGRLMLDAPRDTYAALRLTYRNANCQKHHYNHKFERIEPKARRVISCDTLQNVYGFVHRRASLNGSGVLETLLKDGRVLHSKWLPEPAYAITKPYSLELM